MGSQTNWFRSSTNSYCTKQDQCRHSQDIPNQHQINGSRTQHTLMATVQRRPTVVQHHSVALDGNPEKHVVLRPPCHITSRRAVGGDELPAATAPTSPSRCWQSTPCETLLRELWTRRAQPGATVAQSSTHEPCLSSSQRVPRPLEKSDQPMLPIWSLASPWSSLVVFFATPRPRSRPRQGAVDGRQPYPPCSADVEACTAREETSRRPTPLVGRQSPVIAFFQRSTRGLSMWHTQSLSSKCFTTPKFTTHAVPRVAQHQRVLRPFLQSVHSFALVSPLRTIGIPRPPIRFAHRPSLASSSP